MLARSLRARAGQATQQVAAHTSELANLAEQAAVDAARIARNARRRLARAGHTSGRLARLVGDLETTIGRTGQVIDQTRTRLAGQTPDGATRLVSLHDPDVRPIVKGRLGKPVEFGYKAQVVDNPDGVVLDHQVWVGNPADAPLLVPAVRRVIGRAGRVPGAATADRSYGEAAVDDALAELGVAQVAIPRRGTPARLAWPRSAPDRSGGWSSGAPAVRGGSAISSTAIAGTAPGWTASTAPGSGAAMGSWPTTWSRSAAWSPPSSSGGRHEQQRRGEWCGPIGVA